MIIFQSLHCFKVFPSVELLIGCLKALLLGIEDPIGKITYAMWGDGHNFHQFCAYVMKELSQIKNME